MSTKDNDNHADKLKQFESAEYDISRIGFTYDYLVPNNGIQDQGIKESTDKLINYQDQLECLESKLKDVEDKSEKTDDKSIKHQLIEIKSEIENKKNKIREAEEEIIYQTEHLIAELECLKEATTYSERVFASDIETCSNNICSLEDSPCTEAFIEYMRSHCFNIDEIIFHFDRAISNIENNHMDTLNQVSEASDKFKDQEFTECFHYLR